MAELKRRGIAVCKIFPRQILPQSLPSYSACFCWRHLCQLLFGFLRLPPPGPELLPAFSDPCHEVTRPGPSPCGCGPGSLAPGRPVATLWFPPTPTSAFWPPPAAPITPYPPSARHSKPWELITMSEAAGNLNSLRLANVALREGAELYCLIFPHIWVGWGVETP